MSATDLVAFLALAAFACALCVGLGLGYLVGASSHD